MCLPAGQACAEPVVSENANGAESSNPGGVLEIRRDQPNSAGIWATSSQISRMMAPAGPLEYNRSWYNRVLCQNSALLK